MSEVEICGACSYWGPGDFWGTGSSKHGVLVECKGWCIFKKSKNGEVVQRKRWNYCKACDNFNKKKMTGFIYQGGGGNSIETDLKNVSELMQELVEDNK